MAPIGIFALGTLGYIVISLPFDYIGGHYLPYKYGRSMLGTIPWGKRWARAATIHGLYMGLNAWMLYLISSWLGILGAIGWMLIQIILLGNLQVWVARALVHFVSKPENDRGRLILYLENQDKAFTGGVGGFPGNEVIVMPLYWKQRFPEKIMEMLLTRRHGVIMTGNHGRGFLVATLSNLVCFSLAAYLGGIGNGTVGGTVFTILWFSLLSWVQIIGLLPFISRKATCEIDRWAYYKGADADVLRETIQLSDQLQDPPTYVRAFMPALLESLPDAASRLNHLQVQQNIKGAWHASRLALFLSWSGVNLLCRAVPSNTGRPELWVFLPGD